MEEDSGQPTQQPAPDPKGGRGMCSLADLMDPHRARGTAGLLTSALKYGYIDAFCIDYAEAKRLARELALIENNPRAKAAGVKLLAAMAIHDLHLIEAADKADRLDSGGATERVDGTVYLRGVDRDAI